MIKKKPDTNWYQASFYKSFLSDSNIGISSASVSLAIADDFCAASKSLISVSKTSSFVGAGGASGASSFSFCVIFQLV